MMICVARSRGLLVHFVGERLARKPNHEVFERGQIIKHIGSPEPGDHFGDILATHIACFFNGHFPNLVAKTVENFHRIRRIRDVWPAAVCAVVGNITGARFEIRVEPGPKVSCTYDHLKFLRFCEPP